MLQPMIETNNNMSWFFKRVKSGHSLEGFTRDRSQKTAETCVYYESKPLKPQQSGAESYALGVTIISALPFQSIVQGNVIFPKNSVSSYSAPRYICSLHS